MGSRRAGVVRLALALGLLALDLGACTGGNSDQGAGHAGAGGSGNGAGDSSIAGAAGTIALGGAAGEGNDASACDACLGSTLSWAAEGGLVEYAESSSIEPCRTYHHSRTPALSDAQAPLSCSDELPCELVTPESDFAMSEVRAALSRADVVAAFAAAPLLYGLDPRGTGGPLLNITHAGATISVGVACGTQPGCRPIPDGLRVLANLLALIDRDEQHSPVCDATHSSITCGAVTCTGIEPNPGFPLAPCCPTGLVDTCGIDLSTPGFQYPSHQCVRAHAPGNLDTSCPEQSLGGVVTLPGCCTPGGTCGFQADLAGLGCVDPATLGIVLEGGVVACQPRVDAG